MAILGILLAVLSVFFSSNLRITNRQIAAADAGLAVRLSLLRLNDIVAQSAYIYPAEQSLTINGTALSTGASLLAVLVPEDTTYCPDAGTQTYCGFAYSIEDRAPYAAILGAGNATTGLALIEWQVSGISWPRDTLPTTTWNSATPGILADSADPLRSDLASAAQLTLALQQSDFDENAFTYTANVTNIASALIQSVSSNLVVRYNRNPPVEVERTNYVFSRAIPRAAQSNPE